MKKLIFTLLAGVAAAFGAAAASYDFAQDGVYYKVLSAEDATVAVVAGSSDYQGSVAIPAQVADEGGAQYTVVAIGEDAFSECTKLTSVELPETLQSIEGYAFYDTGLSDITIPASVTKIAPYAFRYSSSLKTMTFNADPVCLEPEAFEDCLALTTLSGPYASEDGRCLLADEGKTLKLFAPGGIESYTLPESVETVAPYVFYYMYEMDDYELVGPKEINMPNVTTIGERAFSLCQTLERVTMPKVETIDKFAFYSCYWDDGYNYSGLKGIDLPKVKTIGAMAFNMCCGMETIVLGADLTEVGEGAFDILKSLTSITMWCQDPQGISIAEDEFYSSNAKYATLSVPYGSAYYYETIKPWSNFENIEPFTLVESVSLNAERVELEVGETFQLEVAVEGSAFTAPEWTSRREQYVTVDADGRLTAVAEGVATVYVSVDGVTAECVVTVAGESGIDSVAVDTNAAVRYYNLNGTPVDAANLQPGIYVKRQGNKTSKVIVK
ncbi:MAG: leucine-rich repeat protein [Muribaculaceae bacterium]|nr:leucine-rich repeat protein [Muribaculaceae bacterium]